MALQLQSLLGVFALLALAWALSENRRAVSIKQAAAGLALTVALALVLLKLPQSRTVFAILTRGVDALAAATRAGTSFVFGYLGGGPPPFEVTHPERSFVLAFDALPLILVVSVLTTVLFYWRILPVLVRAIAWLLSRTLGVGGAVGLSTAANIFVGMVEAPLFIRPYLQKLTRSELFVVMTGGMAGIAGTVLVLYATFLARSVPDAFGHLLVASILGAPAAILIARIMVPETAEARTDAELGPLEPVAESTMDAIVKGTLAGVELLINVVAMLLVFIALVHLVNGVLGFATGQAITLQQLLGYAMAPLCWAMGLPWHEAVTAGALMGVKTVLNEFVAYLDLAALPTEALSPRSRLIMTYALCGFANFGSLGIMIGGLATLAPARRAEIVGLGFKSIVSGTLTTCLLGGIAGLVV
jgi:CNT family concentrative nucleoside transporter